MRRSAFGLLWRGAAAAAVAVAAPRPAFACATCFGQSDSLMAQGTNMGIFLMLGVVAFVLSGFAAFIVYLGRRARLAANLELRIGPPSESPADIRRESVARPIRGPVEAARRC
jgi:hypothetical protein